MTTSGSSPGTALVYGRDAGVQVVQVPAATAGPNAPRVVPARIARGELHMISLGWSSLRVRSSSPRGTPRMSFTATSPVVTLYQSSGVTGVRAWW